MLCGWGWLRNNKIARIAHRAELHYGPVILRPPGAGPRPDLEKVSTLADAGPGWWEEAERGRALGSSSSQILRPSDSCHKLLTEKSELAAQINVNQKQFTMTDEPRLDLW